MKFCYTVILFYLNFNFNNFLCGANENSERNLKSSYQFRPVVSKLSPEIIAKKEIIQNKDGSISHGRFVHPTRMPIMMMNKPVPVAIPIYQIQNVPDAHKNQRFIMPTAMFKKSISNQQFNTNKMVPIKRASEEPKIIFSSPTLSIKTADISDFYRTKEFENLLKDYKFKVDIHKLPNIKQVMSILGTTDAENTISTIREILDTEEGMDLISGYLENNTDRIEDGEFYNIDEDKAIGEVFVSGASEIDSNHAQYQQYSLNTEKYSESWWEKLKSWFGLNQSTKIDSWNKDADILQKVVPVSNFAQGQRYIGKFLSPTANRNQEIYPPFKIFNSSNIKLLETKPIEDIPTLPTIQVSEKQFSEIIEALNLKKLPDNNSIRLHPLKTITKSPYPSAPIVAASEYKVADKYLPSYSDENIKRNFDTNAQPIRASKTYFSAPSIVHSATPDAVQLVETVLKGSQENAEAKTDDVNNVSDLTSIGSKEN